MADQNVDKRWNSSGFVLTLRSGSYYYYSVGDHAYICFARSPYGGTNQEGALVDVDGDLRDGFTLLHLRLKMKPYFPHISNGCFRGCTWENKVESFSRQLPHAVKWQQGTCR